MLLLALYTVLSVPMVEVAITCTIYTSVPMEELVITGTIFSSIPAVGRLYRRVPTVEMLLFAL